MLTVSGRQLINQVDQNPVSPYVECYADGFYITQSKVVMFDLEDEDNPIWEFQLYLKDQLRKCQTICLKCWDWNRLDYSDFIGEVTISTQKLNSLDPKGEEFYLRVTSRDHIVNGGESVNHRAKDSTRGIITIFIEFNVDQQSKFSNNTILDTIITTLEDTSLNYAILEPLVTRLAELLIKGTTTLFDGITISDFEERRDIISKKLMKLAIQIRIQLAKMEDFVDSIVLILSRGDGLHDKIRYLLYQMVAKTDVDDIMLNPTRETIFNCLISSDWFIKQFETKDYTKYLEIISYCIITEKIKMRLWESGLGKILLLQLGRQKQRIPLLNSTILLVSSNEIIKRRMIKVTSLSLRNYIQRHLETLVSNSESFIPTQASVPSLFETAQRRTDFDQKDLEEIYKKASEELGQEGREYITETLNAEKKRANSITRMNRAYNPESDNGASKQSTQDTQQSRNNSTYFVPPSPFDEPPTKSEPNQQAQSNTSLTSSRSQKKDSEARITGSSCPEVLFDYYKYWCDSCKDGGLCSRPLRQNKAMRVVLLTEATEKDFPAVKPAILEAKSSSVNLQDDDTPYGTIPTEEPIFGTNPILLNEVTPPTLITQTQRETRFDFADDEDEAAVKPETDDPFEIDNPYIIADFINQLEEQRPSKTITRMIDDIFHQSVVFLPGYSKKYMEGGIPLEVESDSEDASLDGACDITFLSSLFYGSLTPEHLFELSSAQLYHYSLLILTYAMRGQKEIHETLQNLLNATRGIAMHVFFLHNITGFFPNTPITIWRASNELRETIKWLDDVLVIGSGKQRLREGQEWTDVLLVDPLGKIEGRVNHILLEKIYPSNARPMKIRLNPSSLNTNTMIFKRGDDLRQDSTVQTMFFIFNRLWLLSSLSPKPFIYQYKILPMGANFGVLEFMEDCQASGVYNWKNLNNDIPSPTQLTPEAKEDFIMSMAGSYVACWVLGIRDRHQDNMMIKGNRIFLHIDFGFILNDAPGFDAPIFSIPKGIKKNLSSEEWNFFVESCCNAFSILQSNSNLIILACVKIMNELPDISQDQIRKFLASSLMINETEIAARQKIRALVTAGANSTQKEMKYFIHQMAQKGNKI